jgi:hypothetical protein
MISFSMGAYSLLAPKRFGVMRGLGEDDGLPAQGRQ